MTENDAQDATAHLKQKLMTADEVYVYKIPPLKNAGGHRAEDWNLGKPLQTCSFLVERRGDDLYVDFYTTESSSSSSSSEKQLFAQSKITINIKDTTSSTKQYVEPVVDSSRYFVLKIQGAGNREATIGFGFRDREQAVDLREALQFYERSMKREAEANDDSNNNASSSYTVPKMGKDEKIHVGKGGKSTITKSGDKGGGSGSAVLLKRPPPPAGADGADAGTVVSSSSSISSANTQRTVEKMTFNMADIDLNADKPASAGGGDDDDDDDSGGAVYEGTEDQWATEFEMK